MLTPRELLEITDTMYPVLNELNNWITADVIRRLLAGLKRDDFSLGESSKWQIELYREAAGHYEQLEQEIKRWTKKSDAEVRALFEDAGIRAWDADDAFYTAQGLESIPLLQSEPLMRVLIDTYQRTRGEIQNFTRTTAHISEQRFVEVCDKAHLRVITGAQSYTEAVRDAVNELASTQATVQYSSGHTDTIETAVLRCVRTGTAQASGNMSIQGMIEHDWDVILVSAHLGARYGDGGNNPSNHYWWQGKLYTRTGRTPNLPDFVECTGYGTGEGLCGWNCRHSFGPGNIGFNPWEKFDAEENKKAYDLSQKQRRMESAIRKSKAKLLGLKTAVENCDDVETREKLQEEYDKAALKLSRQNDVYNKFCGDNDLKQYDDRLQAAKWNRDEALRAKKAAVRETGRMELDQITKELYNSRNPTNATETFGTLPYASNASVTQSKVQGYLLNSNHDIGKHKARVLNSVLGYHYENWDQLSDKIYQAAQYSEVTDVVSTQYGLRFRVPMRITGIKGKSLILKSVWQMNTGSTIPRLITVTFDMKSVRKER